jgi:copper resistance protein B
MIGRPAAAIGTLALIVSATPVPAAGAELGERIFHVVRGEGDWSRSDGETLFTWDSSGWVGGDVHKAWFRSEGEVHGGEVEEADLWGLYSRNVGTFWDLQAGVRHDFEPGDVTYAALGVEGLAPYFFETAAHLFVSEDGDVSARIEQSFDVLITQRLVAEPHLEVNLYAQDVPELDVGAGIADIEAGLQVRYEIVRKLAPYVDVNYVRALGETAGLVRAGGGDADEFTVRLGLRFWF